MRPTRRGRRIEHALAREQARVRVDAAAELEASAVRMDRLTALRTAELITEEEFTARAAALEAASEPDPV